MAAALREAKAVLLDHVPTSDQLIDHVDVEAKQPVIDAYVAAQKQSRKGDQALQRQIGVYNEACDRLMAQIRRDGVTCPHCKKHSKDYRLSKRHGCKSAIICTACAWVVESNVTNDGNAR